MLRKNTSGGSWLKRIVIALMATIAGLFFARKTVLAPSSQQEYRLPPVPDVPPAGPEEATPLTEDEQKRFAPDRGEAAAESGDVVGAIEEMAPEASSNGSDAGQPEGARFGIAAEPAIKAAQEAEAARASGTEEGRKLADQIDQRMYIGGAPAAGADAAPAESGDSDTAPDTTSEGFDVSGGNHSGTATAETEDLTDVGLDVDADAEPGSETDTDEDASPDLTSEGFDTREASPAGAISSGSALSGEGYIRTSGDDHNCPEEYPIKGNATSRIYHKPGESSYDATIPEICFASEDIAASMGFRARKR